MDLTYRIYPIHHDYAFHRLVNLWQCKIYIRASPVNQSWSYLIEQILTMSFQDSACDIHLGSKPGATSLVAICNNDEGSGLVNEIELDRFLGNEDGNITCLYCSLWTTNNYVRYQVTSVGTEGISLKVLATSNYAERGHLYCQSFMPIFRTVRGNMWLMKSVWLSISVTWMVSLKILGGSEFYYTKPS